MNVLIACESSAAVRDAFRTRGHNAYSCDLLPCEGDPAWHIQGDCFEAIRRGCPILAADGSVERYEPWDLLIAHPPCTYLCSSGLHWNDRGRGWEKTNAALAFVRQLFEADVKRIAIENPIGRIGTQIRPSDQTIQPFEFGHPESKGTCLWLKNLPPLQATHRDGDMFAQPYPPPIPPWPMGQPDRQRAKPVERRKPIYAPLERYAVEATSPDIRRRGGSDGRTVGGLEMSCPKKILPGGWRQVVHMTDCEDLGDGDFGDFPCGRDYNGGCCCPGPGSEGFEFKEVGGVQFGRPSDKSARREDGNYAEI